MEMLLLIKMVLVVFCFLSVFGVVFEIMFRVRLKLFVFLLICVVWSGLILKVVVERVGWFISYLIVIELDLLLMF